ncbi:DMT family transporter [Plantactinospora soyae]|uniref:Drug/metabolite transporter (DMT)-like permease n=1 Tax=Plantactinospora soyae TaxID=1544732 RepID=A0A927QXA3_9ACTN|nr:DMT family transporter [Plantactinospora soyae]MBE1486482.1 drug/metabolite transporter (DMT)-like permease [Plantactinospora soyae]
MRRGSLVRLALLALLWGSGFLWIKLALRGFTPVQIVFVRLALGALVLMAIALLSGLRPPTDRRTWAHLTVAALVATTIPYTLVGIGEQSIGSNVAGVLNATTPVWTVLIAFLVGTDRVTSVQRGIGIALGFGGTVLIFSPWKSAGEIASWGGLAVLGAAASYAVSFVYMSRYLTNRGISPLMLSASQLVAGTALIALALPFGGGLTPLAWRGDAVASLLVLSIAGTAFAYTLNYRLIADEGATVAATTTYLLPIVAVLLGALVVNEPTTIPMIAGMVLVLGGVALAQQRKPVLAGPDPAAPTPVD